MAKVHSGRNASFFDEFFKVYLPDQSSQRLCVPAAFVKHFNGTLPNNAILKDLGGKTWHVEMEEAENGIYFKNGWQRFASDHSLEFGNFLVFRYKGNSLFDVKIFGKNGCMKEEALAKKCMSEETSTVEKTVIPVTIEEESEEKHTCSKPIHNCKRKYSEIVRKRSENSEVTGSNEASRCKSQRIPSKAIEQHRAFDVSEFVIPSNPQFIAFIHPATPYFLVGCRSWESERLVGEPSSEGITKSTLHLRVPGTIQRDGRAIEVASKFVSKFPFFKVVMKPTYANGGFMHIPSDFAKSYMEKVTPSVTLLVSDQSWPVRLIKGGRKTVHTLSYGWRVFSSENTLKTGDVCVFELVERSDFVMKVSIFRCQD